ncbi:hypothetical protein E4T44_07850 [Aureobasidium sp. EXF-8845]|nr:hypothetical protein E4T44_07850 [Aureobasidium sp. EXF-8845]KAI4845265.1 hypothetical protein E4T45_07796 [Aureobasidium sp. EXF-8846]
MATDVNATPGSVVPRVVTIADNHDLTLRVTEYTELLKAGDDGRDTIKTIVDFHVTRQYLVDNSKSEVIKKLLTTREFAEAGKKVINLDEHNPLAVEVILCAIYRKDEGWRSSTLGQEVTARTQELYWEYLWDVVFSNRFFIIEFHHLDAWFCLWYSENCIRCGSDLLYPCFQFNHAQGFLSKTKNLVYNCAHIEEYKNKKHPDLHVPPRVIPNRVEDALNSARGHLRVLLARWLWKPLGEMMSAGCDCKEKTVFQYLKALVETGGYPIDQQGRKSVNQVCQNLRTFEKYFDLPDSHDGCAKCGRDWEWVVKSAIQEVMKHFDGLCLDCMDHTQPKFLDEHMDYWDHLAPKQWDLKCHRSLLLSKLARREDGSTKNICSPPARLHPSLTPSDDLHCLTPSAYFKVTSMMALDYKTKQALEEQIQLLRSEVDVLREAKTETETKNQELRRTHLRQETKIDQLRKEVNELTVDNETLCDAYNEVSRINTTLRANHNEVSSINVTLRNNIAALDANIDEWEKYVFRERDHLAQLNSYTDQLEKRLEESKARTSDLEERNEDLEDRLVIEKIEMQALEAEYKELERTNEALRKTIKYLDDLVDEDQAEVMRMRKGVIQLKKLWELGELD